MIRNSLRNVCVFFSFLWGCQDKMHWVSSEHPSVSRDGRLVLCRAASACLAHSCLSLRTAGDANTLWGGIKWRQTLCSLPDAIQYRDSLLAINFKQIGRLKFYQYHVWVCKRAAPWDLLKVTFATNAEGYLIDISIVFHWRYATQRNQLWVA